MFAGDKSDCLIKLCTPDIHLSCGTQIDPIHAKQGRVILAVMRSKDFMHSSTEFFNPFMPGGVKMYQQRAKN